MSNGAGSILERQGHGFGLGNVATAALDLVLAWRDRVRQRRHLASLDDRLLRDIGISRAEVEAEFNRPFWR